MKKASRFWIWLFLFSLFPITTSAQVQRYVSKQKALSIVQEKFRGQDVDYYLIDENKSPTWQVFVDAEPMKGWKHDCYVIRIPKSLDISHSTQFPQQLLTTPPQGEYTASSHESLWKQRQLQAKSEESRAFFKRRRLHGLKNVRGHSEWRSRQV